MEFERHAVDQPLYGTVNVLRVGDALVDTGHMAPASREAVADALADGALAGVDRVVLTHPHSDHVGGSQAIPELAALPHTVYEGVPAIVRDFNDYLRTAHDEMRRRGAGLDVDEQRVLDAYFPTGDYAEEDVAIDRVVTDGDVVRVGDYDCEVLHTPGHSAQHMALWHEPSGTLLSADLVSQNGHFMYGPVHADVGEYLASLRRVRDLEPDRLVPGHGPVMDDALARIDDAIEKGEGALDGLREAVDRADGPVSTVDLAREVFDATEATVRFLNLVVCEYVEHLDAEGAVDLAYEPDGAVVRSA